jgi:pimeloyl-ACP methyl ester carboxylesterase
MIRIPADGDYGRSHRPDGEDVLLEDSGHLMMLERPRAVNEQIDRFLAELG